MKKAEFKFEEDVYICYKRSAIAIGIIFVISSPDKEKA
jgi:hypothetical protein